MVEYLEHRLMYQELEHVLDILWQDGLKYEVKYRAGAYRHDRKYGNRRSLLYLPVVTTHPHFDYTFYSIKHNLERLRTSIRVIHAEMWQIYSAPHLDGTFYPSWHSYFIDRTKAWQEKMKSILGDVQGKVFSLVGAREYLKEGRFSV